MVVIKVLIKSCGCVDDGLLLLSLSTILNVVKVVVRPSKLTSFFCCFVFRK